MLSLWDLIKPTFMAYCELEVCVPLNWSVKILTQNMIVFGGGTFERDSLVPVSPL